MRKNNGLRKSFKKIVAWKYLDVTVLIAGLGAYVAQAMATINSWSIWFDEAFSAYLIRFDFAQIAHYTAADVHPPLYYWALKAWSLLFGTSEIALRSLSVLFAVIAIIFCFLLVRRLFGRKAAYITVLLLAVSPMLIRYGQEARMYAMAAAIAMAATYTMVIALQSKKKLPWIIYGILIAAGMWTHYFVAMVWLAHWLWRALTVWRRKNSIIGYLKKLFTKEWAGAYALAIILYIPWMSSMFHQLFDIQSGWFWISPVGADTLTNYLTTTIFFQQHDQLSPWLSLLFLIVVIALVALAVIAYHRTRGKQRTAYMLIASLAIVPVLLVFIASLPPLRSSFIERYLMPSVVSFSMFAAIIIAIGTAKLKSWAQGAIIVLVAGSMGIGVVHAQTIGNFNKSANVSIDTRQVVAHIEEKSDGSEPIISRTPWIFYEAVFYESAAHKVFYFGDAVAGAGSGSLDMLRGADSHKITDLKQFAEMYPTVWYFGEPGDLDIAVPFNGWTVKQSFRVDDPITGKKRYQAVQYDTRTMTE